MTVFSVILLAGVIIIINDCFCQFDVNGILFTSGPVGSINVENKIDVYAANKSSGW